MLKWISRNKRGYKMGRGIEILYTAFADDVALYEHNREVMNQCIEEMEEYLRIYRMKFNFEKSLLCAVGFEPDGNYTVPH